MMKNLSDEDIQRLLETGKNVGQSHDAELYQRIFNELGTYPKLDVENLATDVIKEIQYKNEWAYFFRSLLIKAAIFIVGIATFLLAASSVNMQFVKQTISILNSYKWVGLFIIAILFFAEVFSRKLTIDQLKHRSH